MQAATPEFKAYQEQVLSNCARFAKVIFLYYFFVFQFHSYAITWVLGALEYDRFRLDKIALGRCQLLKHQAEWQSSCMLHVITLFKFLGLIDMAKLAVISKACWVYTVTLWKRL